MKSLGLLLIPTKTNKLKKISIIFFGLFFPCILFGQIYYHDLGPDSIVTVYERGESNTSFLGLDVNNDSLVDFKFSVSYYPSFRSPHYDEAFSIGIETLHKNSKIASSSPHISPCTVKAFSLNDTITNTINWDNYGDLMCYNPKNQISCGSFTQPKYLVFKLYLKGSIYYGWILIKTNGYWADWGGVSYNSLYIMSYAYNKCAGCDMIIGDTLSSRIVQKNIIITPNPVTGYFTLKLSGQNKSLRLYNIYGQQVLAKENLSCLEQINCEIFKPGIYILKVIVDNKLFEEKFVIK